MIKELKFFLYLLVISIFFFLTLKYYFSDINKKNYFRSIIKIDKKIIEYSHNLILLNSDTENITEYVKNTTEKNKKNYNFWKLINNND
jgi:hypothetical protein